ncbi:MAG: hypothetical protein EBY32_04485 [Proteobacteria bacterium]|nr:hypothetical protein [Pseudomonadota bacterium]
MKEPILKVIQLLRSSPFGIEGSYLLGFRFQLFKPSLPIPTAEFRFKEAKGEVGAPTDLGYPPYNQQNVKI